MFDLTTSTFETLLPFIAVGFAAQIVDGALGMAFGVISNTLLLWRLGVPPAAASAGVHAVETFTTAVSGISHVLHRNVNWKLFLRLVIPGRDRRRAGRLCAVEHRCARSRSRSSWPISRRSACICCAARCAIRRSRTAQPKIVEPLGLVGGFLDAAGGGGWGPVVTSNLLVQGAAPRKTIGTVNTAEFFLTATISATFITQLGWAAFTHADGRPADRRRDRGAVRRDAGQARAGARR